MKKSIKRILCWIFGHQWDVLIVVPDPKDLSTQAKCILMCEWCRKSYEKMLYYDPETNTIHFPKDRL